jgi:hypothetical protein
VIFDCCHSGSGTREGARRVRSVKAADDIPEDLDFEIWGSKVSRGSEVPAEFKLYGDASHVLLAACASNQRALEVNGRGAFTQALLDTITAFGTDNLTYSLLIEQLPQLPG